jgi:hypothetical protein
VFKIQKNNKNKGLKPFIFYKKKRILKKRKENMNSKLFIADKFKVGFNLRDDTYTGKLGYVIGYDGKKK